MIPGPLSRKYLKALHRLECPHVTCVGRDFPVVVRRARGTLVEDVDGNRYLDMTSFFAVSNLGHAAPEIGRAIRKQTSRGWHAMGDVHPHELKIRAAKAVVSLLPPSLSQVYFSNSGSDAVETALKTAFLHTGRPGVVAFEGAYHGLGYGAMQTTWRPYFRAPFARQCGGFVRFHEFIPENTQNAREIDISLLRLEKMIDGEHRHKIGVILIEPIQGRAGVRVADRRFLKGLSRLAKAKKILLIFDEIFTGLGRTGRWFAFEHFGVTPDILCLGKGIANGFPISLCVSSPKIFSSWGASTGEARHTSTFLGSPLGCAMILATLAAMKKKQFPAKVEKMGAYFFQQLREVAAEYPHRITEVRGRGLMLGIRFSEARSAVQCVQLLLKQGVMALPSGEKSDTLSFTPPFVIKRTEIDFTIQRLRDILSGGRAPRRSGKSRP